MVYGALSLSFFCQVADNGPSLFFFSLIQQQQTIPITAVYVLASPILSRTRTRRSRSKKAAPKSRWRWLPTWAHTRPPCRTDIPCRLIKCGIREASIVEWVIAFDISRTTCIPFLLRTPHLLFFFVARWHVLRPYVALNHDGCFFSPFPQKPSSDTKLSLFPFGWHPPKASSFPSTRLLLKRRNEQKW